MRFALSIVPVIIILILSSLTQTRADDTFSISEVDYIRATQETRYFQDSVLNHISSINVITTGATGEGHPSDLIQFIKLKDHLSENYTNEELIAFTQQENSGLKCYSFWALMTSKQSGAKDIILNNITDTTLIWIDYGCFMIPHTSFDYMLQVVLADGPPFFHDCQKITPIELNAILEERQLHVDTTGYFSGGLSWEEYVELLKAWSEE